MGTQWPHTSRKRETTELSWKNPLKKLEATRKTITAETQHKQNLGGEEGICYQSCYSVISTMTSFSIKNYKIKKHVTYIGKKVAYRKYYWGDPDVVFNRQGLKSSCFKYVQGTKGHYD